MLDSPGSAPDKRVQHGGQSPEGEADVGRQGGQQSPLPVVRPEVKTGLAYPAEQKKPPGKEEKLSLHKAGNVFKCR